ncbi:amidohydrolase family protein [Clostridium vitabionis]|uniref:amidohydrolase family protein n=1 Tax=Clostridium vitabionis TaxID=2784388 RepID=UPI001889DC34|nr:amidohydrolase family protein [Clostridium vitabionis]
MNNENGEAVFEDSQAMIDLHLHPGWTDFLPEDQARRTAEEQKTRIREFLRRYRKHGFVLARDAGGFADFSEDARKEISGHPDCTAILPNGGMLGNADPDGRLAAAAAAGPFSWVKIFATGGVGAEPEHAVDPSVTREYFFRSVQKLHAAGKKVMVHTWGGVTLDWCIEAGVDSVEHGVYMTHDQAQKLAERQIPLIPTCGIYRLLAERPELFALGAAFREHAKRAAEAQRFSVPEAIRAGVLLGFGTDFYADPALADEANAELATLVDLGLSREAAMQTAVENARKILGLSSEEKAR